GGTLSSMTSAWGDYNNDGWMDVYVPHGALGFGIPGFQLYQNNHDGTFTELNIDENSLNFGDRAIWAASAADFNNDGLEDIMSWARGGGYGNPNSHALLINHGNWTFTNEAVSAGLVPAGVPVPLVMGCQVADYDNDGDLDMFMSKGGTRITIDSVEPNRLFRNDGGNANNWFYLDLEGVVSNRDAVGAKVKLTSSQGGLNPRVQYRDLQAGSGF